MCYNCGCFLPQDDMGHPENITDETFKRIADLVGKSEHDIKESAFAWLSGQTVEKDEQEAFETMIEKATHAWGQSTEEAKKNTLDLLKSQLGK